MHGDEKNRQSMKCRWCDADKSVRHGIELTLDAADEGWKDVYIVEADGDDAGITHHGTCPRCIWEQAAMNQQAVS